MITVFLSGFVLLIGALVLFFYKKSTFEGISSVNSTTNLKEFFSKTLDLIDDNIMTPQESVIPDEEADGDDYGKDGNDYGKDGNDDAPLSNDKVWREKLDEYLTAQNSMCGIDSKLFNSDSGPPYPVSAMNGFR